MHHSDLHFYAQYVIRLLQIGELEGEINHLRQQLSHATEQHDTLKMQLDSINAKSAVLESQLHKEKSKSREAQVPIALPFGLLKIVI